MRLTRATHQARRWGLSRINGPTGMTSLTSIAPGSSNNPLPGRDDVAQDAEEVGVKVSPKLWSAKVADVTTIIVEDFIRVEPPCDTEVLPRR